jgi:hypothetical protein
MTGSGFWIRVSKTGEVSVLFIWMATLLIT